MEDFAQKKGNLSTPASSIPKNLPKKLPPELLRNLQAKKNIQSNTQQSHVSKVANVNATLSTTQKLTNINSASDRNTPTNLSDMLDKRLDITEQQSQGTYPSHLDDKDFYKLYTHSVTNYHRAIKHIKKPMALTIMPLSPVQNIFMDAIPETLWFFPRSRVNAIINRLELTVPRKPIGKRITTMIIIIVLIMAIIGSGIYIAYVLTRHLNPQDTDVSGDITFNLEDVEQGGSSTTTLNIAGARLNEDLTIHPTITNNTNIELYLRFYVTLDYIYGKDYLNVDKDDLSVSYPLDEEKWWADAEDSDYVTYYLFKLKPNDKVVLFDSFQINGASALENDWQGKSLDVTVHAEVCQVLAEDQTFPPGWSTYWVNLITD